MKATLEKKALSEALSGLMRVVEKRNTVPILANVMLTPGADSLALMVSDLNIEMQMTLQAESVSGQGTTVPAAMLSDVVARLADGAQIVLEDIDGKRLALKSARSRFLLPTQTVDDFPDFAKTEFAAEFDLPAAVLSELMLRPGFAVADDPARPYLEGIHLSARADTFRAQASDGHRAFQLEIGLPDGAETMPENGVIVPRKTCTAIAKICEGRKKETVRLCLSRSLVRLQTDGAMLTSKLIEGTFPDLDRLVPRGNDKIMVADKAELEAALLRVGAIMTERGRAAKWSLTERGLALSAKGDVGAEATEEVEVDYDSHPLDIGFNTRYACEVVGAIKGERVRAAFADPGSPTLFTDPDEKGLAIVLMPMRV